MSDTSITVIYHGMSLTVLYYSVVFAQTPLCCVFNRDTTNSHRFDLQ